MLPAPAAAGCGGILYADVRASLTSEQVATEIDIGRPLLPKWQCGLTLRPAPPPPPARPQVGATAKQRRQQEERRNEQGRCIQEAHPSHQVGGHREKGRKK